MGTKHSESEAVPAPVGDHDETIPMSRKGVDRPPPRPPTVRPASIEDDCDTDVKWPPDESGAEEE